MFEIRRLRQQQAEQSQARSQAEQSNQVGGIGLDAVPPALDQPYVHPQFPRQENPAASLNRTSLWGKSSGKWHGSTQ